MSRYLVGAAVVQGISALVLDRLANAPHSARLLNALPPWMRAELVPTLDAIHRAAADFEAVSANGTAETEIGSDAADSMPSDELLTTRHAAVLLGLSPRRVRQLAAAGLGRRVGGRWLLDPDVVAALAATRRNEEN